MSRKNYEIRKIVYENFKATIYAIACGVFFLTKKKINSYFGTMTRTNSFVLECCEAIIKQMSYFSFVINMP